MKYYYTKGNKLKKILLGGNNESRIDGDSNKIIVVAGKGYNDFNVFEMNNFDFEKEKKELSYGELVNYLINKNKNIYYINMPIGEVVDINNAINEGNNRDVYKYEEDKKPIYVLNGDKILKVNVEIDKDIIKESIAKVYEQDLMNDSSKFKRLKLADFLSNKELVNLYKLPVIQRNNEFVVPEFGYDNPSLFYVLSGIYNASVDKIDLSDRNIHSLYQFSDSKYCDILDKVFDNIEVKVIEKYDLNELENNINFYHKVKLDYDYGRDIREEARSIANYSNKIITNAKSNEIVFNNLYLIKDENIEKTLKIKK